SARRLRRREQEERKALKRRRDRHSNISVPPQGRELRVMSYRITEDRFEKPDGDYASLSMTDQERAELFEQVHEDPTLAMPRLCALLEQHPDSPVLQNWLTITYQTAGDDEAAEKIASANYARNPNYLFAKLNVAKLA